MYPDYYVTRQEMALACQSDQSGHALACIDRIKRKCFGARCGSDRFLRGLIGDTVGFRTPFGCDLHMLILPTVLHAE